MLCAVMMYFVNFYHNVSEKSSIMILNYDLWCAVYRVLNVVSNIACILYILQ